MSLALVHDSLIGVCGPVAKLFLLTRAGVPSELCLQVANLPGGDRSRWLRSEREKRGGLPRGGRLPQIFGGGGATADNANSRDKSSVAESEESAMKTDPRAPG